MPHGGVHRRPDRLCDGGEDQRRRVLLDPRATRLPHPARRARNDGTLLCGQGAVHTLRKPSPRAQFGVRRRGVRRLHGGHRHVGPPALELEPHRRRAAGVHHQRKGPRGVFRNAPRAGHLLDRRRRGMHRSEPGDGDALLPVPRPAPGPAGRRAYQRRLPRGRADRRGESATGPGYRRPQGRNVTLRRHRRRLAHSRALRLEHVERLDNDVLWLRYRTIR